jgi:hypothetical protein
MQRRQFLAWAVAGAGALSARQVFAEGAQLRLDIEIFSVKSGELPAKLERPIKRLRRTATLTGPDAETLVELLRAMDGQIYRRFTQEVPDGIPLEVRVGRRLGVRGARSPYGFTLIPRVAAGEVTVDAELRTGKSQPSLCETQTVSYALKVSFGGYAAFWLNTPGVDQDAHVAIVRFHPAE